MVAGGAVSIVSFLPDVAENAGELWQGTALKTIDSDGSCAVLGLHYLFTHHLHTLKQFNVEGQ